MLNTTNGTIRFRSVHEVQVEKSIFSFVDTAKIRVPATARLAQQGELCAESIETAKQFQEGDKVEIKLGYDNNLETEFKGFIKRVNFTTPCEIECEGYSWQLRKKTFAKSWKDANVKDILQELIAGTDITIHKDTPDTKFEGQFVLNDENAATALEKMKKEMFLTVYFIGGDQLYVGLEQTAQTGKEVKYKLGWNTIKDDQLKYRRAEDTKIYMRVSYKNKKGKTLYKKFGHTGGVEQPMDCGMVTDMNLLKRMVNAKAREFRYAGYEGKITAFLQPYAQHGWKAVLTDNKYSERNGSYIITSTEVHFGTGGARRMVGIGRSLTIKQDDLNES
ncbi:MAG: hypothetical protein JST88_09355 [Bacteroidetes bacterium]|nr:hypothetical protein [Bacteroidota bacterium]